MTRLATSRTWWIGAAVAVAACGAAVAVAACDAAGFADRTSAIIGGALDTGDPAVAYIRAVVGGSTIECSGVLVSPRVVLTAGHCVAFDQAPTEHTVEFGNDLLKPDPTTIVRQVVDIQAHPQLDTEDLLAGYDIGLILLDEAVDIAPLPFDDQSIIGRVGAPIRLVGFGRNTASVGDIGVKRTANSRIVSLYSPTIFEFGDASVNICYGDSGGAVLIDVGGQERLAGIASYTLGFAPCAAGSGATAVHAYRAGFIQPWIDAHDPADTEPEPPPADDPDPGDDGDSSDKADSKDEQDDLGDDMPAGCSSSSTGGQRARLAPLVLLLAIVARRRRKDDL